jgi:hypothetical protein
MWANAIVVILLDCKGGEQAPATGAFAMSEGLRMPNPTNTVTALVFGVAAGAMLVLAPIASAEDPPPCNPDGQCQQPPVDPTQFVDPALGAMQQLPAGGNPMGGLVGGIPGAYTPSGVGTGGEALINGVPTYIPPQGLTLPPGAQVGPPTAWIESVKETGCAPDCVPEMYRYLFEQTGDTAQDVVGAATPPQQENQAQPQQ